MRNYAIQVVNQCVICCMNNPKVELRPPPEDVKRGISPGECWQIDFSELPQCNQCKYLLVLTDTFTTWPEAFTCRTSKAREVVKKLLGEIIP